MIPSPRNNGLLAAGNAIGDQASSQQRKAVFQGGTWCLTVESHGWRVPLRTPMATNSSQTSKRKPIFLLNIFHDFQVPIQFSFSSSPFLNFLGVTENLSTFGRFPQQKCGHSCTMNHLIFHPPGLSEHVIPNGGLYKWGYPFIAGGFKKENPIEMDDD